MSIKLEPERLSRSQIQINALPIDKNYVTAGGPGTGKTLLALLRAKKVVEGLKNEGNSDPNVLFIVYNRPLQNYLRNNISAIGMQGHQASTYHSWLYNKIYKGNVKYVQERPYNFIWEKVIQDLKGDRNPNLDHVIIDEAQDLPLSLVETLCDISANYTIFIDNNQSISEDANLLTFNDAKRIINDPYKIFVLNENHRNSQAIIDFSQIFLPLGDIAPIAVNKEGRKPVLERYENIDHYAQRIVLYAANNPDQNIAVVMPDPQDRQAIYNLISKYGGDADQYIDNQETPNFDPDSSKIKIFTYKTHKGLEFDVVFLPELQNKYFKIETESRKNQFMVAVTRAKERLFLGVCDDNSDSYILNKIESYEELIEKTTVTEEINSPIKVNSSETNYDPFEDSDDIPF